MLKGVEVDKLIRLAVVLAGVFVTWYSIAEVPHSNGVAVKDFVVIGSEITFWLAPFT